MATLLLAATGAALGGGIGGSIAGLTATALGKAAGATLGSLIDQRLLGLGSEPVATGKVERFRVMGGAEGAPLPRVFGRTRVAGQMIWSSRFLETVTSSNVGGKGGQQVREYGYTVSFALAICEGPVVRIGRIWADGQPVDQSLLNWRLHSGTEDQLPDPLIAAIEGDAGAPSYRGTAYAVFEDLDLAPFGNRIPQLNFEVFRRPPRPAGVDLPPHPADEIAGVALVPGTGEYSLATEIVSFDRGKGDVEILNAHNDLGLPDLVASTGQMVAELPNLGSVSLVVSWFGNDLRCGACALRPAVEQAAEDATMAWRVGGLGRDQAQVVNWKDGRPLFGGTPADTAVVQGIEHLRGLGVAVMFYPFILMDILPGNGLPDPWSMAAEQPAVPWRGRITLSVAPGRDNSPDQSALAAAEVANFFGTAQVEHFDISGGTVQYRGPDEWSYRRFILHYAHLCALAGGVDAFCVGSEMRGLTQIRSGKGIYPAVAALRELARDVRRVLGPDVKIGYAADWSEYFGHHPQDGSGDVYFHLDPLWGDPEIDFIGIDNYMPLSDWRAGDDHLDAAHGSIYDLGYLRGNVAGGEGYDWYYADESAREAQSRTPIRDTAAGEDWIFRCKDILNWWSNPHHDRSGGVREPEPTAWQPRSKPIWFTELGCPAVDKGTNQPNVFVDPKSSESFLPYHSDGARDDFIQQRYLQAMFAHWADPANNPRSGIYDGRMVEMRRAHVWAWDARPWPDFPARLEVWADGGNYPLGHWLNGRAGLVSLAEVVAEIASETRPLDLARLHGGVTGYTVESVESARQSLQPLMLAYGFDGYASGEGLAFVSRDGQPVCSVSEEDFAYDGESSLLSRTRAPASEAVGRVTVGFVKADADYQAGAVEAASGAAPNVSQSSTAIVFRDSQAQAVADRWLHEGLIAQEVIEFAVSPSRLAVQPGDVLNVISAAGERLYRIDKIEDAGARRLYGVRVEREAYVNGGTADTRDTPTVIDSPPPVYAEFLDLPLLTGEEVPHAPHIAAVGGPGGGIAVYSASEDSGYTLNRTLRKRATIGETLGPLMRAEAGLWMPASLDVRLRRGALQSRSVSDVLNGANAAAVRSSGDDWEVIQFLGAELIGNGVYRLSGLLRGQAGTDGTMPEIWPAGSDFVLLDSAVTQIDLALSARGLARNYRVGPAGRPYDHPSFVHSVRAFDAIGLRPYAPAHLRARRRSDGDIVLNWIRRTRIDGDNWQGEEVPLGESSERYAVRVRSRGVLVHEFTVTSTAAVYTLAEQERDSAEGPLVFEVAQVSDQFGPGPYQRISLDG
ncbi:baseplate multidomain protein megatron [Amaricoccus solimangrovi]|uniref:Host specificity protein n=1 Tax=Amaricoccus solimangrovi TaxID=2589815 RepID=A0A501WXU1_9RHOB|nr:glycoside hydrolase/phage tail family protein [Amaricoccus solimangrovi]TPE50716.1 host specificity protein [Amaricoccus solimangrovi]